MEVNVMYSFEEFKEEFKNSVREVTEEKGMMLTDFREEKVIKNNGVELVALVPQVVDIFGEKMSAVPNFYLHEEYKNYRENIIVGMADGAFFDMEKEKITSSFDSVPKKNSLDFFTNPGALKNRIFIKLVNGEKNKDIIEVSPTRKFNDLLVTYRVLVDNNNDGLSSALLSNQMAKITGLTEEELYDVALKNTKEIFGVSVCSLSEMLSEKFGMSVPDQGDDLLWFMSNEMGINGASTMLFTDEIDKVAEKFDSDIYIIPSSIHELLVLPVNSEFEPKELEFMVREVNGSVVTEQEILSDHLYKFDRKTREVTLCNDDLSMNKDLSNDNQRKGR